jgi:dihydroorotase
MLFTNFVNSKNIEVIDSKINLTTQNENGIDCSGCYVLPLLFDLNVKNSESVSTLNASALNGGVGSLLMIPKHKPISNKLHLEYNLAKAKDADIELFVAIEGISEGKLTNISTLTKKGAKAIFINSDEDMNLIRRVFEYSEMLDIPIFVNAFNNSLSANGVMNDSKFAYFMGLSGITNYVESVEVAKILELAKNFNAKIVFQGITTKESIEILKNRPKNVYIDVNIDNLLLCDEDITNFNTNYKTMPPLRSISDKDVLINAIKNDEIDFISSNHIAVPSNKKDVPFEEAEYGISKLDVFASLVYSMGIDIEVVTKLVSTNPSKFFGIDSSLENRNEANFMIVKFEENEIKGEEFASKGKNSPFIGKKVNFKIEKIIKNGKVIK